MAGESGDDFSLDPFQLQQVQLAQQLRLAEAQSLRRGTGQGPSQWDIGNRDIVDTGANVAQYMDMPRLRSQQLDLSNRAMATTDEAMAGADPRLTAALKSPFLRKEAVGQYFKGYENEQVGKMLKNALPSARAAMDQQGSQEQPSGGGALPQTAATGGWQGYDNNAMVGMAASNYAGAQKAADMMQKISAEQMDPTKPVMGPNGPFMPASFDEISKANARRNAAQNALGRGGVTEVKDAPGNVFRVPTTAIEAQSGFDPSIELGGPPMRMPPGAPNPYGPAPQGSSQSGPPQGAAPQQGSGQHPLLGIMPQLEMYNPNNPVNPVSGAKGPYQIMPKNVENISNQVGRPLDPMNPQDGAFMANQVLMDAQKRYPGNDMAQIAYYNGGARAGDAVASGKMPPQETQAYLWRYGQIKAQQQAQGPQGGPPQGQPPPQGALPQTTAAMAPVGQAQAAPPQDQQGPPVHPATQFLDQNARVVAPSGPYDNPTVRGQWDDRVKNIIKEQNELGPLTSDAATYNNQVRRIGELIQLPHYSTWLDYNAARAAAQRPGARPDPLLENSEKIVKASVGLSEVQARVASSRGTNLNLQMASQTVPTVEQSLGVQKAVWDSLAHNAQFDMGKLSFAADNLAKGYPTSASNVAYNRWAEAQNQPNPTQAPGGSSAARGVAPAAQVQQDQGGGVLSNAMDTLKNIGGFLTPGSGAYTDMAKALPSTLAGIVTNPGAQKDAWMDAGRGLANFVGVGDRAEAVRLSREHEARAQADPQGYGAGFNFGTIANPTALVGGPEASLAKLALAGAVQGASRPQETWGAQAWNAGTGAVAAPLLGGVAAAAVPATRMAAKAGGQIADDVLKSFPAFRKTLTEGQIDPSIGSKLLAPGTPLMREGRQIEALNKDLLTRAGMDPKAPISGDTLLAAKTDQLKQWNNMFSAKYSPKIDSLDKQALVGAVQSNPAVAEVMNKTPALSKVYGALENNPNPIKISSADLGQAWKELNGVSGNPEAIAATRQLVKDVITRKMNPASRAQFDAMSESQRTLSEIEQAWNGGSDRLSAADIAKAANNNKGGVMSDAATLINNTGVGKAGGPKLEIPNVLGLGAVANLPLKAARWGTSKIADVVDRNALGASPMGKAVADKLRHGLFGGIGRTYQGVDNATQ